MSFDDFGDETPATTSGPVDALDKALQGRAGSSGMQRVQTEYQTAIVVAKPRDLQDVLTRVLDEAARMGTDFIYHWRQKTSDPDLDEGDGKVTIEGMSIDGAMVIIRNWGNAVLPTRIDSESATHFVISATFIDLETGFSLPRLYRQRKSGGPGGRMADDRKEDISFQIGQSKAQRNAVDKATPRWLIDKAIAAAKRAAEKKYEKVEEWKPKFFKAFLELGVDQARMELRMRKPATQWTPRDLLTLNLLWKAIRDRETTAEEEFPTTTQPPAKTVEDSLRAGAPSATTPPAATATPPAQPTAGTTPPVDPPATKRRTTREKPDKPAQDSSKPTGEGAASRTATPADPGEGKGPAAQSAPASGHPGASASPEHRAQTAPGPEAGTPPVGQAPASPASPADPAPSAPAAAPAPAAKPKSALQVQFNLADSWSVPLGGAVVYKNPKTGEVSNTTTASRPRVFGETAVIEINDGFGGTEMVDLQHLRPFSKPG